jgi:hypothetical protein
MKNMVVALERDKIQDCSRKVLTLLPKIYIQFMLPGRFLKGRCVAYFPCSPLLDDGRNDG